MRPFTRAPILALSLVTALSLSVAGCGGDDDDDDDAADATTEQPADTEASDETTAPETMAEAGGGTIVDVAAASDDFETLVAAVQAADLVETLSGPGPFTVFAPTDEAFEAALASLGITAEELLADTEQLSAILTYHVLADEVPAADVTSGDVATVNGAVVTLTVGDDGSVMVNDANVVTADVEADNGVIHVIDKVLLPPSS